MTAPYFEYALFGEAASLLVALGLGLAFGWFLERGGMGNAKKLAAQFYGTDLTVLKIMFSAIVTAALGAYWLARLGVLDLSAVYVPHTYLVPQLAGGVVFGVGFVMGGLCPGTSCVAASSGRTDGLVLIAGMVVGIVIFNEAFPLLESFYETTPMGRFVIPDALGISHGTAVFALVVAALVAFRTAERIESGGRA